jgi:hypothetical protein
MIRRAAPSPQCHYLPVALTQLINLVLGSTTASALSAETNRTRKPLGRFAQANHLSYCGGPDPSGFDVSVWPQRSSIASSSIMRIVLNVFATTSLQPLQIPAY